MGFLSDLRLLRSGFRWGEPRPRSLAPRESAVPERESDLSWARMEPVRTLRFLIQRGLMMPFTEVMAHPKIEGAEFVRELERPHIIAANHVSHADTPLLLHAMSQRVREQTVVAAAADYFYDRPWLGRALSLWLNTFPFSRSGGASSVLHSSSQLLKSGWNLLIYAEGTRSKTGAIGEFKPGIGHLALENRAPVIPMYVRGSHRIMPKGQKLPLPAPAEVKVGKPLVAEPGEGSRAFTVRIESAVRALAEDSSDVAVVGTWIERWRASAPRRRV